jgi:uncharacterized membrane protein YeiH
MGTGSDIAIILDIIGVTAFAVSGAFKGMKHKLDILGVIVLGIITALGGGIIRDMLLNTVPSSLLDERDIYFAIGASLLTYLAGTKIHDYSSIIRIFDAAGLALFTVIGAQKGISAGLGPLGVIMMGTLTGVAGGMIRDLLVCEVPFVLKEEVYALFCIIGALMYKMMISFGAGATLSAWSVIIFIFVGRLLAIKFNLHLPKRSL